MITYMTACIRILLLVILLLHLALQQPSVGIPVLAFSSSSPQQPQRRPQAVALPSSPDDIVKQAASAITRAFAEGNINKQTIRLPLSESMYSAKEEGFVADRAIGWQGGPKETIRYLSPLVSSVLKGVRTSDNTAGLVAKVSEQILLDFDGSTLQTAEHPAGALYDVQALLQPNTDGYYLKTIAAIEEQFSDTEGKTKRLFLLVNPAWRDRSSWGFFGGAKAQALILDRYTTTYALDQFVVRGEKVSLLKSWPDDWAVYVTRNDASADKACLVTTFKNRPEYKDIDAVILANR
mmetsp:Transcript_7432/g.16566  ORF Transcript_7432/g.16566 Transcript_7432/m.16566 type:complete len:293 (+) Transcript_7432:206-1084(+)